MKNTKILIGTLLLLSAVTMFFACEPAKEEKQLTILSVNDMHAAIDHFPRFAFMADSLRKVYPDLLLLGAGDNQTGHPVNDQYKPKGFPMIALMNAVQFDASAVGNHEFDTGEEGFALLTRKAEFDFLCANVGSPEGLDIRLKPYTITTLSNGLKVGILSLVQINEAGIPDCHPDNVKNFRFTDPFEEARAYAKLKDSCDVFIALTHLGFEDDVKLAEETDFFDLIIGGHSHTKVEKEQIYNNTLITQAKKKLQFATLTHISVKPDGSLEKKMELLTIDEQGEEKPELRKMVDDFSNDNPALVEQIAFAEADFTAKEQVGYLMADALFSASAVDIALINDGGVRIDKMAKGKVSPKEVYLMDPFGNEIVLFQLTGEEIYDFYRGAYTDEYHWLYAAGLKAKYTVSGDSLRNVELFTPDNKPFDKEKTYKVAMNTFMASAMPFTHKDPGKNLFVTTAENMIKYLKEIKTIKNYQGEKRTEIFREK